jgi:SulP family sulfate permease
MAASRSIIFVDIYLIVVLGEWVKQMPMAALVAVMIMVSISTFNWSSITS